jgi:lysophospholipase L1-like esterase
MNAGPIGGRLAALLVGLALVALLEGGLRLVPSLSPPAFTLQLARVQDRVLHAVNPAYARRFFGGIAGDIPLRGIRMTPRPYIEPAPDDALRVLFAGGSTVEGYPHPKRLSAPSYLQEMLGDLYPERQVEVFNAGITAASSFAVARAVEDGVAALKADLVVVYTGHNEFYGVYGTSSLAQGGQGLWTKRGHYAMMHWRMTRLVGGLLAAFGAERAGPPTALIEVMSRAGPVPAHDPQRARAAVNLEGNLRDVAAFCRTQGIPLVLCTLTSNERGFAPARAEPPLEDEERQRYLNLLEAGGRQHASADAVAALRRAEALWADDAYLHFLRGYHLESLGDGAAARVAYAQARALDSQPWRAPTAFNQVVRRVAADVGALLAEVEASFVAHSPAAGVGWELMADHVHPTAAGKALMARAVVDALEEAPPPWGLASKRHRQLQADDEYRRRLGDLPVERLAVVRAMAALFGAPPMDRGNEGRESALLRQAGVLREQLSVGEQRGMERWLEGEGPDMLALNVAEALFTAGDYPRARDYYRAARLEEPYTIWGDLWSTLRWIRCDQLMGRGLGTAERIALRSLLDRLRFLGQAPDFSPGLQAFIRGYAHHFLGERARALAAFESAVGDGNMRQLFFGDLLELLVAELMAAGRSADAERYAVQVSAQQHQEAFGQALVERIKAGQKPR